MALGSQCWNAGIKCDRVNRYSNPDLIYNGDPMGVPGEERTTSLTGPADARRTLNQARHIVANYRTAPTDPGGNRPPETVTSLAPLTLAVDDPPAAVDVGGRVPRPRR